MLRVTAQYPSFVNEDHNISLKDLITLKELKAVVKSMQKEKGSGPNGWIAKFFFAFMDVFEEDLLRVIWESRLNGRIHVAFNATFISLIPKSNKSINLEDYKPIALCNCIYKVIAKIIAIIIKGILSSSVS